MPDNARQAPGSRSTSSQSNPIPEFRDNQQIQDDNQTSGESVVAGQASGDATQPTDLPNQAANKEKAEGSRENAGGITNRPLSEERDNQERVPPRGEAKEGGHA